MPDPTRDAPETAEEFAERIASSLWHCGMDAAGFAADIKDRDRLVAARALEEAAADWERYVWSGKPVEAHGLWLRARAAAERERT